MNLFRIIVVDDSALFRTVLRNVLAEIPGCTVVASVADGKTAIEKIAEHCPDLVTLDVEMPDISGIEVLRELKKRRISANVVMVSRFTEAGAQVTTDALIEGAFDFVRKPSGGNPAENKASLRAALEERITALRETASDSIESSYIDERSSTSPLAAKRVEAVVIGCSTGGPDALARLIPNLPADFPVPVFVVQHMPERFTGSLAARLNEASELEVAEAVDGMRVAAGQVVIARGGKHLEIERRSSDSVVVRLTDAPHENSCRPAVDYTIRSAVKVFGGHLLVVVLTGMGRDGLAGCELARCRGSRVLAQHADGCTVFGMPKAVIQAGYADNVIKLPNMPSAIMRLVMGSV